MNRASEGIVNNTPVKPIIGPYSRGQRSAASDIGNAIAKPNRSARLANWICSTNSQPMSSRWLVTQDQRISSKARPPRSGPG